MEGQQSPTNKPPDNRHVTGDRTMETLDTYDKAALLLDGVIFDMEELSAGEARLIADILETQGFELRVKPEFSLAYAVPSNRMH